MKKLLLIALLTCFAGVSCAYELNGSLSDNGGGDYSVSVENDNGHEYSGDATDNDDGTLDVNVEDDNGESYSGTATDNGDGTYDLDLQNESTGGQADGTLTNDN